jgi:putative transcriptional regulator
MPDERFKRSVIYVCAHSEDGAMGIILNQSAPNVDFSELVSQLLHGDDLKEREPAVNPQLDRVSVHVGGPVDSARGFVLHSSDYFVENATLSIDSQFCLTATVDILRAIAAGNGPERAILALGYSGWSSGQLESEIQANGWLHCKADPELVFETPPEEKYAQALSKLGIDPSHLVSDAGHA